MWKKFWQNAQEASKTNPLVTLSFIITVFGSFLLIMFAFVYALIHVPYILGTVVFGSFICRFIYAGVTGK